MTKPLFTLDHDVGATISNGFGLLRSLDFFFKPPAARTEHLVHEIIHAVSLGVAIRRDFDVTIEHCLSTVRPLRADRRNEAYVLAAEWIFYSYTDRPIRVAQIDEVGRDQDVPGRWLDRARKSRRALILAERLARWALEHGVLVKTGLPTDLAFADLRRRIRETPVRPRSRR